MPHAASAGFCGHAMPGPAAIQADAATQRGLGHRHNLSRRSALYASLARVSSGSVVTFAVPGGMTAGGRSTGHGLGMRHAF